MNIISETKVIHKDREYFMRAWIENNSVHVRVFLEDSPATDVMYSAKWETALDFEHIHGHSIVKQLIAMAEEEILSL